MHMTTAHQIALSQFYVIEGFLNSFLAITAEMLRSGAH
jgi:hypothetical protein